MPRVRSQYIAEMRERFEVVDRVKATSEEKASLTKAIEDEQRSSPEVTPSKESTLPKDKADAVKLKFAVEEEDEEEKVEIEEVEENEENDVESGIKVSSFLGFLISILYASNNTHCLKITQNVSFEFWHFDIFHPFLTYGKIHVW